MIGLFRRRPRVSLTGLTRRVACWHRYEPASGALSCCRHCTSACRWDNWHPAPCRHCIHEMEAVPPLPDCVAGSDGRCVTCEELHGVRITHRERP